MSRSWLVRAGRESAYVEDFLSSGVVAIGWRDLGKIDKETTKDEIKKRYQICYPLEPKGNVQLNVGQIDRFLHEVSIGDEVLTYDRNHRIYHIGIIESDAIWSPDIISDLPRARQVKWINVVQRDQLKPETLNTLGAIMTIFELNSNVVSDIKQHAITPDKIEKTPIILKRGITEFKVAADQLREQLLEKAEEDIEDRILLLNWENIQNLMAGILRTMGYRTTVSPGGPDRGVDIFASPDGLGLQDPRIFVEVKHRFGHAVNAQEIRSFIGGRNPGDKCLYISTGGFTKDAKYEADRAGIALKLLELVDLRKLLVDNYEDLDEEIRNLIPLKRVYILAQ